MHIIRRALSPDTAYTNFIIRHDSMLEIEFPLGNYGVFASKQAVGDRLLASANEFLATLPEEESLELMKYYLTVKTFFTDPRFTSDGSLKATLVYLQNCLNDLLKEIHLEDRLIEFCENNANVLASYPDMSLMGSLPHHTSSKTFFWNDYVNTTAISILSKLLAPVWAMIYDVLQNLNFSIEESDEVLLDLVSPFLNKSQMHLTYSKIFNLVQDLTRASIKRTRQSVYDDMLDYHEMTHDDFVKVTLSYAIVSRLTIFNLLGSDEPESMSPNIVKYIADGITRSLYKRTNALLEDMD